MRIWLLALSVVLFSPLVQAETPSPQQLLQDMAQAHRDRNFSGRLVYTRGGDISTLEVLHGRINGRDYERLTHLDGQLAELIRNGEQVICVHPDKSITRYGGRVGVGPLALQDQLANTIPAQYRIHLAGHGRIAGRDTWQMKIVPQDVFRYGYRLWVDNESHLMLRSEMVDDQGRALERLEFISIDLNPKLSVDQFDAPSASTEQALESVDASGHPQGRLHFVTGWLPDGFVASSGDVRLVSGSRTPVSSKAFSDGLAAFTLFVERLSDQDFSHEPARVGPTVAISRSYDEAGGPWLVTLVGEVPVNTAKRVLDDLSLKAQP